MLTILRAYWVAGRPGKLPYRLGSFENWSDLIVGAIVWLDQANPLDCAPGNHDEVEPTDAAHKKALKAWLRLERGQNGVTAKEAIEIAKDDPELHDALCDYCETANGQLPTPRELGCKLRADKERRRDIDGSLVCFDRLAKTNRRGSVLWFVQGMRGMAGDV